MPLHAKISGDIHAAAPLVLLHGFGAGGYIWRQVMAGLGGDFPIIAYDLPGHCGSLHSEGIGGAGRMARAVINDLDRRGIEACHIAGHSLGGAAAAILALKHSSRVRTMTLLAPGGFGPAINHRALTHFATADTHAQLRRAMEVMVGFNSPITDQTVIDAFEGRNQVGARAALKTVFASLMVETSTEEVQQGTISRQDLAALTMPVLVVWGGEDCILPVAQSENLPDNMALHRIAQAGHMLVEECPQQVIDLLRLAVQRG
ncbi:MAG: alpha/beta fold hydrolase [Allorhizobium sp.]